jgi:hypothetical protein
MKLLALLAIALGLLSAVPAEARHHHRGYAPRHAAIPLPRPRPETADTGLFERLMDEIRPQVKGRTAPDELRRVGLQMLATDMEVRR